MMSTTPPPNPPASTSPRRKTRRVDTRVMKATRLSKGGGSVAWQAARFASTITWSFVLPVVASAFLGGWIARVTERPVVGLAIIGLGVAIGIWTAGFQLWNLLHGEDADGPFDNSSSTSGAAASTTVKTSSNGNTPSDSRNGGAS